LEKSSAAQQNANSLKGDTNQEQQQIQQQTQEGTTQIQNISSLEGPHPLPLGKLIDNIPTKDNKTVCLTFDDGPGEYTKEIATILRNNGINGSFFWIGDRVTNELGQLGHQMIEQGNVIGSHTMHHDALGKENGAKQKSDLTQAASLIGNKVGHPVVYIRPPYGSVNKETKKIAKELGQYIIFWQVDSLDWSLARNPEKILTNIENGKVKPGSIILMHERKQTVEILPKVIEYLRSKGYTFAALPSSPVPEDEKAK
jgi:peptidoglycan/xylan/chitin deacetylase (PgdA/CDA1 family)